MRTLLIFTAVTLALLTGVSATAKTPDGLTPAVEEVCDTLIDATPGLYGLCVAYCEAHDADLLSPSGDLNELDMPNIKILQNYNKKMTESDPPMPCVALEIEDCPCWTADELSMVMPPVMLTDVTRPRACLNDPLDPNDPNDNTEAILENFDFGYPVPDGASGIQLWTGRGEGKWFCLVSNFDYPDGPPKNFMFLSEEQGTSCRTLLAAHANLYKTNDAWDCFAE